MACLENPFCCFALLNIDNEAASCRTVTVSRSFFSGTHVACQYIMGYVQRKKQGSRVDTQQQAKMPHPYARSPLYYPSYVYHGRLLLYALTALGHMSLGFVVSH
jgi:hypothetical protein